MQGLVVEDIDG